jgi:hypothetical protein
MTSYYRVTTARQTGTQVVTAHADALGLDADGGHTAWYNVCDEHGHIIGHTTLALARSWASAPLEWCEGCMADAQQEVAR